MRPLALSQEADTVQEEGNDGSPKRMFHLQCTFKWRSHLGITGCGWADAPLLHSAIDVAPHDAAPHVVQEQPTAKGTMGTELRQALADLERLQTMFMV